MQPSGGQATGETTRPYADVIPPPAAAASGGWPSQAPLARSSSSSGSQRQAAAGPPRLGPFVVERELARGGMGVVYVARHEHLGRRVALKVMKAGAWADPEEAERFRFEAQAAARLKHPHIVGLHEVGEQGGTWYLAMDLVEGPGSLQAMLERQGPLEPRFAAAALEQVARAVHFAHTRSVLHRDLKPHNVLVDAQGEPHLTDFGLAKDIGREEKGYTVTGQVLGTPAYMAPEQASGDPALVDRRSDVYGLGATLYACLAGQPPFRGNGVMDVLRQVIEEEPAAPSALRPRLDRDLETIVLTCLRKDPAARYATALLLADDLARWARGEPIAARRPGRVERLARWARRRAPALAAVAAAVVLVAGVVVAGRLDAARDARAAAVAEATAAARQALAAAEGGGLAAALEAVIVTQRWRHVAGDEASLEAVREAYDRLARAALDEQQDDLALLAFRDAGDPTGAEQVARARARRATGEVQALLARMASQTERGVSQEQIALAVRHPQPEVTALLMAEVERCAARLRGGHELTPGDFSVVGLACFATVERTDLAPDLCVDPLAAFVRAAEAEGLQELRGLALGALCALRSPRARAMAAALLAEVDLERLPDSSRMVISRLDLDDLPAEDAGALLLRARARLQVTRRPADQRAALADLTRALDLQADSVEALMLRGRLLSTLGDLGAAQGDLDRVAVLAPEAPGLDLARADLAAWRGDRVAALAAVERAVARAQPGDPLPLMTRAALRRQGDLAGAFDDAARACQVAPRDPRPHVLRADLLLDRGDPSAALEALTLATSLRQHTAPQVWVLSAQAHIDLGQLDRAAQALGRLPATARTDGRFLFVQARLHLARGDPAAARGSLDQAIQLAPDAAELYALRATTHGMQGDPAAAEADLDEALRRARHPALHLERGVLRRLRGDLRGAIEDLDACLALDPRYARGLAERARARFEQGDLDGALEDAGRCLALGREDPQALNVRGQVRLARGEVEAGVADLERALEIAPTASGQDKLRELIRRAREGR